MKKNAVWLTITLATVAVLGAFSAQHYSRMPYSVPQALHTVELPIKLAPDKAVSIDGLILGATEKDVIKLWGAPSDRRKIQEERVILSYNDGHSADISDDRDVVD